MAAGSVKGGCFGCSFLFPLFGVVSCVHVQQKMPLRLRTVVRSEVLKFSVLSLQD
jgi:hypothetical protein